jgi:hypothetical protein
VPRVMAGRLPTSRPRVTSRVMAGLGPATHDLRHPRLTVLRSAKSAGGQVTPVHDIKKNIHTDPKVSVHNAPPFALPEPIFSTNLEWIVL